MNMFEVVTLLLSFGYCQFEEKTFKRFVMFQGADLDFVWYEGNCKIHHKYALYYFWWFFDEKLVFELRAKYQLHYHGSSRQTESFVMKWSLFKCLHVVTFKCLWRPVNRSIDTEQSERHSAIKDKLTAVRHLIYSLCYVSHPYVVVSQCAVIKAPLHFFF